MQPSRTLACPLHAPKWFAFAQCLVVAVASYSLCPSPSFWLPASPRQTSAPGLRHHCAAVAAATAAWMSAPVSLNPFGAHAFVLYRNGAQVVMPTSHSRAPHTLRAPRTPPAIRTPLPLGSPPCLDRDASRPSWKMPSAPPWTCARSRTTARFPWCWIRRGAPYYFVCTARLPIPTMLPCLAPFSRTPPCPSTCHPAALTAAGRRSVAVQEHRVQPVRLWLPHHLVLFNPSPSSSLPPIFLFLRLRPTWRQLTRSRCTVQIRPGPRMPLPRRCRPCPARCH